MMFPISTLRRLGCSTAALGKRLLLQQIVNCARDLSSVWVPVSRFCHIWTFWGIDRRPYYYGWRDGAGKTALKMGFWLEVLVGRSKVVVLVDFVGKRLWFDGVFTGGPR